MSVDEDLLRIIARDKLTAKRLRSTLRDVPQPKTPIITQSDVDAGVVIRYFAKYANDNRTVVEIDRLQYERLQGNPRFTTVTLEWRIVGQLNTTTTSNGIVYRGIKELNEQAVANADLTFRGLRRYITNFEEFWVSEN